MKLEERPIRDPSTLVTIAEAQVAVGDTTKALNTLESVLKVNPKLKQALQSQENIKTQIRIREDLSRLRTNPSDRATRQHLTDQVNIFEKTSHLNTSQMLQIASTNAALGDTVAANNLVDSALDRSPKSRHAVQLRNSFSRNNATSFRR